MPKRNSMGFVHVDVILRGPGGSRSLRMLVDTDATLTWVPEGLARELGARELGPVSIRLADNRIVDRIHGELEIEILGRKATRLIVFARDGEEPLLGVDTLEGLLLQVDPVERRLKVLPHALALAALA
jgi:predicted aspartyl protease